MYSRLSSARLGKSARSLHILYTFSVSWRSWTVFCSSCAHISPDSSVVFGMIKGGGSQAESWSCWSRWQILGWRSAQFTGPVPVLCSSQKATELLWSKSLWLWEMGSTVLYAALWNFTWWETLLWLHSFLWVIETSKFKFQLPFLLSKLTRAAAWKLPIRGTVIATSLEGARPPDSF